jgi:hypothetical protein
MKRWKGRKRVFRGGYADARRRTMIPAAWARLLPVQGNILRKALIVL